jgi:pimeloyl-ACP methyl ester carboxylesterase
MNASHSSEGHASSPRFLYLHGFASGPESSKGRALTAHFEGKGLRLERLNLRVPSFERLRLSAMMSEVRARIGGERDRAVLFGSSLGGLTACRVAEEDPRVCALVLLAPAFRMIERWRARLGDEAWGRWRTSGWLETEDYSEKRMSRVEYAFAEEAEAIDARSGGWPDVRVPTLIVHGVRDEVVDVNLSRTWARGKRHVRLVEVDDGHELGASIERIAVEAGRSLTPFGL